MNNTTTPLANSDAGQAAFPNPATTMALPVQGAQVPNQPRPQYPGEIRNDNDFYRLKAEEEARTRSRQTVEDVSQQQRLAFVQKLYDALADTSAIYDKLRPNSDGESWNQCLGEKELQTKTPRQMELLAYELYVSSILRFIVRLHQEFELTKLKLSALTAQAGKPPGLELVDDNKPKDAYDEYASLDARINDMCGYLRVRLSLNTYGFVKTCTNWLLPTDLQVFDRRLVQNVSCRENSIGTPR